MKKETLENMEQKINDELDSLDDIENISDRVEMFKACAEVSKVLNERDKNDSQAIRENKWYQSPVVIESVKIGGSVLLQLIGIWATSGYITKILHYEETGKILVSTPGRKLADIFKFKSTNIA